MIIDEAKKMYKDMVKWRRYLHQNPEVGFNVDNSVDYVENLLTRMGYSPYLCGSKGIVAECGLLEGRCVLLRADIDALPMKEESGEDFSSNNGNFHGCGHDMHTAMLLGAAKILKDHEDKLPGKVRIIFQPAEETLEGAKDMIEAGVLQGVNAALMIHVMTGTTFSTGTVIVADEGVSAPGSTFFTIEVKGKGCHGSSPSTGIDPIIIGAHILLGLEALITREVPALCGAVLTVGSINGGVAANVIPDKLELKGTFRTMDVEVANMLTARIQEIVQGIAKTFRGEARVIFDSSCPPLTNDGEVREEIIESLREIFPEENVILAGQLSGDSKKMAGSEDFAYISQEVPSIMVAVAAGAKQDGYEHMLHHPKVRFDEDALITGCSVYAYGAMKMLENTRKN